MAQRRPAQTAPGASPVVAGRGQQRSPALLVPGCRRGGTQALPQNAPGAPCESHAQILEIPEDRTQGT